MLAILIHIYRNAEAYTFLLSWIVVPLFFLECYYFFSRHADLFRSPPISLTKEESNAAN